MLLCEKNITQCSQSQRAMESLVRKTGGAERNTSFLQYAKKIHLGAVKRYCPFASVLSDILHARFQLSIPISSHSS